MTDKLLRAADVAEILQVDKSTVYTLIASGALPSLRVSVTGRAVRVHRDDLEAWIEAQRAAARAVTERDQLITDIREAGKKRRARA